MANRSRSATLRQYCTSSGPRGPIQVLKPSSPRSLFLDRTRSIGPIARATGIHLCSLHALLIAHSDQEHHEVAIEFSGHPAVGYACHVRASGA